jgi:hypothetical protein
LLVSSPIDAAKMKSTSTLLSLLPVVANAAFFPREQYESGAVHQIVIDAKNVRL